MIDWRATQTRLHLKADGVPGRATYAALFALVGPRARPAVIASLANAAAVHCPRHGADASVHRLADLLAQGANETGGWSMWEENLRYTAARIRAIWPTRFPTLASAQPFAWDAGDADREDIALANRTYGDRMGNQRDGTADNDGWDRRGQGFLMLTGEDQYLAADRRLALGLDLNPEIAALPAPSLLIALDFYTAGGVWAAIDRGDTRAARRLTNGGTIGLTQVDAHRRTLLSVLVPA